MATKETPLMKQYNTIKAKYPDALLLFRVGDFYETFGEDAIRAAGILNITLTARNNGGDNVELAGFPHHSLNTYLPKLVMAGCRVAICDQLEDPKMTKTIVKRGVGRLADGVHAGGGACSEFVAAEGAGHVADAVPEVRRLDDVMHLASHLLLEIRNVGRVDRIPERQRHLAGVSSHIWVVAPQFLFRRRLVVVGEIAQEEE